MQRKLEEKDRQIADLRRQLAAKDRVMETQRAVLEEASHNFTPALRAKVTFRICNGCLYILLTEFFFFINNSWIRTLAQWMPGEINTVKSCMWHARLFPLFAQISGN